jgi:hypothetical protein
MSSSSSSTKKTTNPTAEFYLNKFKKQKLTHNNDIKEDSSSLKEHQTQTKKDNNNNAPSYYCYGIVSHPKISISDSTGNYEKIVKAIQHHCIESLASLVAEGKQLKLVLLDNKTNKVYDVVRKEFSKTVKIEYVGLQEDSTTGKRDSKGSDAYLKRNTKFLDSIHSLLVFHKMNLETNKFLKDGNLFDIMFKSKQYNLHKIGAVQLT